MEEGGFSDAFDMRVEEIGGVQYDTKVLDLRRLEDLH